jgi:hypothetical protein
MGQRQTKFQFWDTVEKCWTKREIFMDAEGCLWAVNQANPRAVLDLLPHGRYIKRQFTGLFDKNGKEIYTKDILKLCVKKEWGEEKKLVLFLGGCFCILDVALMQTIPLNHFFKELHYGDEPFRTETEVIGNIFETPEKLMEMEK